MGRKYLCLLCFNFLVEQLGEMVLSILFLVGEVYCECILSYYH